MTSEISVYDGYIRINPGCVMGDDLMVVNTARVSYDKASTVWSERDKKLLKYLWDHKHTSPFRHCFIRFEIKAPIFVLRQWMKHQVGCSWNEVSARYVQVPDEEFFYPIEFRKQDDKNKQSSFGLIDAQDEAMDLLHESYQLAYKNYLKLISLGVCREQARSLLPVGTYSKAIWTASLQAIMNFLELRLDQHAQKEIRDYAEAVLTLTSSYFPESMELIKCQDALNVEKPFKD